MQDTPSSRESSPALGDLEQLQWIQRLAYRLCADRALAEDLGQEVLLAGLLAGLGKAPAAAPARRAWFAGVLRNKLRMAKRSRVRRRGHEELSAVPVEERLTPAPDAVLMRFETHRRVADAVYELDEPYRTTLLQRYFEGLTPTEMAALDGTPVGTVKTRITRGLRALESELDGEFGEEGEGAWFSALLPLAALHARRLPGPLLDPTGTGSGGSELAGAALTGATGATPAGGLVYGLWVGVLVASLCALVLGAWSTSPEVGGHERPIQGVSSTPAKVIGEVAAAPSGRVAAGADRGPRGEQAGGLRSVAPPTEVQLVVRVVGLDGQPVSGMEVVRTVDPLASSSKGPPESLGRTDGNGALEARVPLEYAEVRCLGPGWAVALPGSVIGVGHEQFATVVVSPARTIVGQIRGANGQVLAGVKVGYRPSETLRTAQVLPLNQLSRPKWFATSDVDGGFSLVDVPEVPGAVLFVHHPGYQDAAVQIPDQGAVARDIQLVPEVEGSTAARPGRALDVQERAAALGGRVAGRDGAPISGLRVVLLDTTGLGIRKGRTPDRPFVLASAEWSLEGGSRLHQTDAEGYFEVPVLKGHDYRLLIADPSTLAAFVTEPRSASDGEMDVIFAPDLSPQTLSGQVTDAEGQPIVGASVQASLRVPALTAGGESTTAMHRAMAATDADGFFRLDSLVPGEWLRVHVFAGPSYEVRHRDAPDARADLVFQLPRIVPFYVHRAPGVIPDADRFELRDLQSGARLSLSHVEGAGTIEMKNGELVGERSPVYRARVGRHILVAFRGDEELLRTPVVLRSESATQVLEL